MAVGPLAKVVSKVFLFFSIITVSLLALAIRKLVLNLWLVLQ